MSKLFKMCSLVVSAVFLFSGIATPETVDRVWSFDIGVAITPATVLNVNIRNVADGDAVPDATSIVFDQASATLDVPWVECNQYLKVQYSSNYGSWGVRILTDNIPFLNSLNAGWDVQFTNPAADGYLVGNMFHWVPLNGVPAAEDDYYRYPGMRRADATIWDNPNEIAVVGWQPTVNRLAVGTHPAVPTVTRIPQGTGERYQDGNIGDLFQTPRNEWAYLSDKTVYDKDDLGGVNHFDGRIYLGRSAGGDNVYNYNLVVFGSGVGGGYMQIPQENGDGDTAIYLTARFAYTDYGMPGDDPHIYLLGAGNYGTRLLVELVNE